MGNSGSRTLLSLAKPSLDVCLCTNSGPALRTFWRDEVGLPTENSLVIRAGLLQHRHVANGSIIKINEHGTPLVADVPTGLREVIIASPDLKLPRHLRDPDGNRVSLVPPGDFGIYQIGVRLAVHNLDAAVHFYSNVLGFVAHSDPEGTRILIGESIILLHEDSSIPSDPPINGIGWRFITLQIFDCERLYRDVLLRGGREGAPPRMVGTIARYCFVRDPDGNWIELSQRASLTGPI